MPSILDLNRDDPFSPSPGELARLLAGEGPDDRLFAVARDTLLSTVGDGIYLRGLVETSNKCRKNCLYCGLRRDNSNVFRYDMSADEILAAMETGYASGLRSFLLQSGELPDRRHLDLVEEVLLRTAGSMPGTRMVLSMGELPEETLARLRTAGAHRYLLRIESSSSDLYSRFHPGDMLHNYAARVAVLRNLRSSGWQTGTGVLIGLPGQTRDHLAADLMFMKDLDIDMCGMGPYLPHGDTPMMDVPGDMPSPGERVLLTLRMIALARILMPTINIAATTALQTLDLRGLEMGLNAGANVVMPNLTPAGYRSEYNLYQGKVQVDDGLEEMLGTLRARCSTLDRKVMTGNAGDPVHYSLRCGGGVSR